LKKAIHAARLAAACACIAATAAFGAPKAAVSGWVLVDLGTLGGPGSYGSAVNDSGVVVGCSDVNPNGVHAFVWREGRMQDLGTATDSPDGNSCALAVNEKGLVAGRAATGELVVWNGKSVTRLGVHGNVASINDDGVVAGSYSDTGRTRGFVYRDGVLQDVGALGNDSGPSSSTAATGINAKGEVVGSSNGHAFLYTGGALRDLGSLGGNNSVAKGINDRGQVVGFSANAHGQPSPFFYDGTMRALPGDAFSEAVAINNRVQIVGSGEGRYGFLVADGQVTALDLLPSVRAKGWHHLEPTGLNDHGWIVGTAMNAQGDSRAFLLMPRSLGAWTQASVSATEAKGRE